MLWLLVENRRVTCSIRHRPRHRTQKWSSDTTSCFLFPTTIRNFFSNTVNNNRFSRMHDQHRFSDFTNQLVTPLDFIVRSVFSRRVSRKEFETRMILLIVPSSGWVVFLLFTHAFLSLWVSYNQHHFLRWWNCDFERNLFQKLDAL